MTGLSPEVPPPNKNGDQEELESLLFLASALQGSQRPACKNWPSPIWRSEMSEGRGKGLLDHTNDKTR